MALFGSRPAEDPETRAELQRLSEVVSRGIAQFAAVGDALIEIRERELYRVAAPSFEQYCQGKWEMSARHAQRLIDAANVARNLRTHGLAIENERQARALKPLSAEDQVDAVREASEAPGPMGPNLRTAVTKRRPYKGKVTHKPMTIRVPGCSLKITPNGRFSGDYEDALQRALDKLRGSASIDSKRAA